MTGFVLEGFDIEHGQECLGEILRGTTCHLPQLKPRLIHGLHTPGLVQYETNLSSKLWSALDSLINVISNWNQLVHMYFKDYTAFLKEVDLLAMKKHSDYAKWSHRFMKVFLNVCDPVDRFQFIIIIIINYYYYYYYYYHY